MQIVDDGIREGGVIFKTNDNEHPRLKFYKKKVHEKIYPFNRD